MKIKYLRTTLIVVVNKTKKHEPQHEISNNVVCATSKASDQPAHTLLIKHHLKCLSLKGDSTGSSEFTLVKMPHCWKSHVTALSLPDLINITPA